MSTVKKYGKYSKENLQRALEAIKRGVPRATAAKEYGVPRTTLIGKIQGKYPEQCKSGVATILTEEEEKLLSQWIINMAKMGFPVTRSHLLDSVAILISKLKRSNTFTDGRPGRHWYEGFLKRHPEITQRMSQNLCASRAAVTEFKLRNWFDEIKNYFEEQRIQIDEPERVFNADESAFFLSPKGGNVLAQKGTKIVYDRSGDERECLTVLITGNAAGILAPPMIMYAYDRIPKSIVMKVPDGWGVGKSDNGWMTSESFFEYISNVFYPWLVKENIQLPVILYVDGHKSHVTCPLSDFCREKGIILISLLPNSTHILQPLDVGLFKSLKNSWKKCVRDYKIKEGQKALTRDNFAPVFMSALRQIHDIKSIFRNAFRTCGLYPFSWSNLDLSKLLVGNEMQGSSSKPVDQVVVNHLQFLEKILDPITVRKFHSLRGGEWTNDLENKNLYETWHTIFKMTGLDYQIQPSEEDMVANEVENEILEDTDNVIIEIEKDLVLEEGWENMIVEYLPDDKLAKEDNSKTSRNDEQGSEQKSQFLEEAKSVPDQCQKRTNLLIPEKGNISEEISLEQEQHQSIVKGKESEKENNLKETLLELVQPKPPHEVTNVTILEEPFRGQQQEQMKGVSTENEEIAAINENVLEDKEAAAINENVLEEILRGNEQEPIQAKEVTPEKENHLKAPGKAEETTDSVNTPTGYSKEIQANEPSKIDVYNKVLPGVIVPSPFKKALFWPEPTSSKKYKQKKEKVPSVTTSDAWKAYYLKKVEDKKKIEERKEELKRKRNQKMKANAINTKTRTKKVKSDNKGEQKNNVGSENIVYCNLQQIENQDLSENDQNKINQADNLNDKSLEQNTDITKSIDKKIYLNDYVIVNYEGDLFPGIITEIGEAGAQIMAMAKSAPGKWKWPKEKDEIWYTFGEIIEKINPPLEVSKRHFFVVPEMDKYS